MPKKGVDISVHNGNVDFNALKRNGIEFVIVRCGYGNDSYSQDDERFRENIQKAEDANMPYGVYFYSYATDMYMCQSETEHALRLLSGLKPTYGVWYDVEDPSQENADLISFCEHFCKTLESKGYYVGIYSSLSWLNTKLNSSRLDRYDKWVAQWYSPCEYSKPYSIWQYTDSLNIGGKNFDGNILVRDFAKKEEPKMSQADFDRMMDNWLSRRSNSPASSWASKAMDYVKANSFMRGDRTGMHPQAFITRQEVAQVIYNITSRYNGG